MIDAPLEPHRLVADIDATLEQQIFDPPQRERIAELHHHREADHFGELLKYRKELCIQG